MKTPREILFECNRAAEPKLDALRKNFVSEQMASSDLPDVSDSLAPGRGESARPAKAAAYFPTRFSFGSLFEKIRRELFLPYRRMWIGLAAVWAVILGVNLVTFGGMTQPALAKITPTPPEVLTVLKEQKQMMAQLLGPAALPPKRSETLAPRTQLHEELYPV